jgi:hypothetical protein
MRCVPLMTVVLERTSRKSERESVSASCADSEASTARFSRGTSAGRSNRTRIFTFCTALDPKIHPHYFPLPGCAFASLHGGGIGLEGSIGG